MNGSDYVLRELAPSDIPALMALDREVGWNHQEKDFEMLLDFGRGTCVGYEFCGKLVSSACTVRYDEGDKAWVNLVIVSGEHRGKHLASRMILSLIERFGKEKTLKLDATPAGSKVYEKLSFVPDGTRLMRYVRSASPFNGKAGNSVVPFEKNDLVSASEFDGRSFGTKRTRLLEWLYGVSDECRFRTSDGRGFLLSRSGRTARNLGPVIAANDDDAIELIAGACRRVGGTSSLIADVPLREGDFLTRLEALGFVAQRPFIRMAYNSRGAENVENVYAVAGPEFG